MDGQVRRDPRLEQEGRVESYAARIREPWQDEHLDAALLPLPQLANAEAGMEAPLVEAARSPDDLDREFRPFLLRPDQLALVRLGAALRRGVLHGERAVATYTGLVNDKTIDCLDSGGNLMAVRRSVRRSGGGGFGGGFRGRDDPASGAKVRR